MTKKKTTSKKPVKKAPVPAIEEAEPKELSTDERLARLTSLADQINELWLKRQSEQSENQSQQSG